LPIPSPRATSDGRRPSATASPRTRCSARSRPTRPLCLCPPPGLELSQSCWLRMAAQFSPELNFSRFSLVPAAPNQLRPQLQRLLLLQQLLHLLHHLQLLLLHLQLLLLLFPPLHHRPHLVQQHHWQLARHHHQCHQRHRQLEQHQCLECLPLTQLQRLLAPGVSTGLR